MPASTESSAWSWHAASAIAGRLRKSGLEWKGRQGGEKPSQQGEHTTVLSKAAAALRPRSLNRPSQGPRRDRPRSLWPTLERVKAAPLSPDRRKFAPGPCSPACGLDDAASSGETIGPGPSDGEAEDSGSLCGACGRSLPLSTQCRVLASPAGCSSSTPSQHSGELSPCESALPPWLRDGPLSPCAHSDPDPSPPRRHTFVPAALRRPAAEEACDEARVVRRISSGSDDASGCSLALASDGSLMSAELRSSLTAHSLAGGPPSAGWHSPPSPAEEPRGGFVARAASPVARGSGADAAVTLQVRARSKWDCESPPPPPEPRVFRLNMSPKAAAAAAAPPPPESPPQDAAAASAAEARAADDEGLQRVVALCQPHDAFSSSERCDIFACQELCTEEIDDGDVAAVLPDAAVAAAGDESDEEQGEAEHAVKWAPAFAAPPRGAGGASPFSRPVARAPPVERGPGQTKLAVVAPRPPGSTRSHKERQLGKLRQWQHHVRQQSRLHRLCSIPTMLCAIPECDSLPGQRPPPRSGPSSARSSCAGFSASSEDEACGDAAPSVGTEAHVPRTSPVACSSVAVSRAEPAADGAPAAAAALSPKSSPSKSPTQQQEQQQQGDRVPQLLEALTVGAEWVRPWV